MEREDDCGSGAQEEESLTAVSANRFPQSIAPVAHTIKVMVTSAKKPPAKKAPAAKAVTPVKRGAAGGLAGAKSTFTISRSESGRFIINGVDELKLVNQHPKISVHAAPGKPRHLTPAQISAMVKLMKVA